MPVWKPDHYYPIFEGGEPFKLHPSSIAYIVRCLSSNMNEHIITGYLAKAFHHLGLLEATHLTWRGSKPQTFVFGKGQPIDGLYHSPELEITSVMQLPFLEGVGDHRTTQSDVTTRSVIGKLERRVELPQARKLANGNEKSVKEYIKYTTQLC